MSTAKHTPTPWRAGRELILDGNGKEVAITDHRVRIEAYANAEFIVRAVNCHDELVEALRAIATEADYDEDDGKMDLGERLLRIEHAALAALAHADPAATKEPEETHEP